MKRFLLSAALIVTAIFTFASCSNDNEEILNETGEIIIDNYVDGVLQNKTRATVQLDGGYATGAGKYTVGTKVPVAAYPNTGYKLESFTGGSNKYSGSASYNVDVVEGITYFKAKFQQVQVPQNVTLTINFIDKNILNSFEHMWVDVTINGSKSTVELDLRTGGWSSIYITNATPGSTFILSNFRSHYVASGTSTEARNIFNTTNNYGVVYCNEKSGSLGKSSTISGTLNSNTTYNFYID